MPRLAILAASLALAAVTQAQAQAVTVVVSRADCARLVRHVPAPDVAYRPGIDVHGRPVAPADLPGTPRIVLPEEFEIKITVDLRARLGLPADPGKYAGEVKVGTVRYRDGRAWFNGQPLEDESQARLSAACAKQLRQTP
ncbi:MAG: hypothetical protein ACTSRY_00650 [Alphaproteobacteria bacterium]